MSNPLSEGSNLVFLPDFIGQQGSAVICSCHLLIDSLSAANPTSGWLLLPSHLIMLATIDQVSDKSFDYIVVGRSSRFPSCRDYGSFDKSSNTSGGGVRTQPWLRWLVCTHILSQTTGLVVAARLSEDPSASILVLEAGDHNLNDPEIGSMLCFISSHPLILCIQ